MHKLTNEDIPEYAQIAIDVLDKAGYVGWLVGGWVRDSLRGVPCHDIDMTSAALWQTTAKIFRDQGYMVHETGTKHGTVTVVIKGHPIEITTFRTESGYTDCRHPDKVEFVDTIEQDLARRDFTVNAMAYNPKFGLKDPYGGVEDLEAKIIRCVGDPYIRFQEDALRILRAIRFSSRMDFSLETKTAQALSELASSLEHVADERIGQELRGILKSGKMGQAMRCEPEVMCYAIPELGALRGFDQKSIYHRFDIYDHTASVCDGVEVYSGGSAPEYLRWAALFHDIGKPYCFTQDDKGAGHFYTHPHISGKMAKKIMGRMAIPKQIILDCFGVIVEHDVPIAPTEKSMLKMLGRLDKYKVSSTQGVAYAALVIRQADAYGKAAQYWDYAKELCQCQRCLDKVVADKGAFGISDLYIKGGDIIRLKKVEPGQIIGEILQSCLNGVVNGDIDQTKDAQFKWLEDLDLKSLDSSCKTK